MDAVRIILVAGSMASLLMLTIMLSNAFERMNAKIRTLEAENKKLTRENERLSTMLDYESIADLSMEE